MGFNLAILQSSEKVDSFIDKFIIFFKGRANTSALSFRNFAEIFTGIKGKLNLFTNIFKYLWQLKVSGFVAWSLHVIVFGCLTSKFAASLWHISWMSLTSLDLLKIFAFSSASNWIAPSFWKEIFHLFALPELRPSNFKVLRVLLVCSYSSPKYDFFYLFNTQINT